MVLYSTPARSDVATRLEWEIQGGFVIRKKGGLQEEKYDGVGNDLV